MHVLREKRFSALETLGLLALGVWSVQGIGHALSVPGIAPGEIARSSDVQQIVDAVTALESKLQYVQVVEGPLNGLAGPHVIVEGANFHVRSGAGSTDEGLCNNPGMECSGLGNLIVGYNEQDESPSHGRTGAHNLIVGPQHEYTNYGGFAAGWRNDLLGVSCSVLGGSGNTAGGETSTVGGGAGNVTDGEDTSVGGGAGNSAIGYATAVGGGSDNEASGSYASVSGGSGGSASGQYASVSGGSGGSASGEHASVSGGRDNTASGEYASASGGSSNVASGSSASVSGGVSNLASGAAAGVSGGFSNDALGSRASVSGGANRSAIATYDWAAGSLSEDN